MGHGEQTVESLPQAVRGRRGCTLAGQRAVGGAEYGNRLAVVLAMTAGTAEALGAPVGVHGRVAAGGVHVALAALSRAGQDAELGEVGDVQGSERSRAVRIVEEPGMA